MLITILIIVMIVMHMQNKLCTIQFFSPPNNQFTAPPKKVQTPGQERIQKHPRKQKSQKKISPWPTSFINWAWPLWYGKFPLAILGYLSGCAPSQFLHTCSLTGKTGKSPLFIATTENISVINILLLNPKHSSYWEENSLYPSWNQYQDSSTCKY